MCQFRLLVFGERPRIPDEMRQAGLAQTDPFLPFIFLQNRRSAKLDFCETELYEAVVGDLTLPAAEADPWIPTHKADIARAQSSDILMLLY